MYPFRCSYKDCFDCYRTIDALVKHCKTHGRETQDTTTQEKKVRYKCSLCLETFDLVAQLLSHTQVHEENKYKCDECDWQFSLIAGLTLHGKDCHDMRHHACSWCVEYFDNVDALYTHTRNKHHFECTICFNVSPTAEELEQHIKENMVDSNTVSKKYKPRDVGKRGWSEKNVRRKKWKQRPDELRIFHARSVWKDSTRRRELDKHITDKHIFICGECLKTFKTKAGRDAHMKTDHKEVPTQMTKQEKLLAEEYRKRESREEKDR